MCSAPDPAPMPPPAAPPPPPAPPVEQVDVGSVRKAEDAAANRSGGVNMRVDRVSDSAGVQSAGGGSGLSSPAAATLSL